MRRYDPSNFFNTALGKLMALNAADGPPHNLPGLPEAAQVFGEAKALFRKLPACEKSYAGFLKILSEHCFGRDRPFTPAGPSLPLFSNPSEKACLRLGPEISTVVGAEAICRLLSDDDRKRFAAPPIGIYIPGTFPDGSADQSWIQRLAALSETDRRFQIKFGKTHGRPLVWFTRREEIDELRAVAALANFVETVRDYLGLIHYGPTLWNGSTPNHLFILHYSSSAAIKAQHWRPGVFEGVDNRRFRVHVDAGDDEWGRAANLEDFEPGCSERVLLSLQRERFEAGAQLTMEYLGVVSNVRGLTKNDDDTAFIKNVRRRRRLQPLVQRIDASKHAKAKKKVTRKRKPSK